MSGPIAVVTGGAGFIGSHAVDALVARGFTVRVIDDLRGGRVANIEHVLDGSSAVLHEVDICTLAPDSSIFAGADLVLHFAGIGDIVPSVEWPAAANRSGWPARAKKVQVVPGIPGIPLQSRVQRSCLS